MAWLAGLRDSKWRNRRSERLFHSFIPCVDESQRKERSLWLERAVWKMWDWSSSSLGCCFKANTYVGQSKCPHSSSIMHVIIFSFNLLYWIQSTLQHNICTKSSQAYAVLLLSHFTGEEIGTEVLSDLPEVTQPAGGSVSIRPRQAGSRGHVAEVPLGARAPCPAQWEDRTPDTAL